MQNLRTHYFNDGDVVTGLCASGEYGAHLADDENPTRGHGHSRLAAIADLVEKLGLSDDDSEPFDHQAAAWDRARDYAKQG